MASSFTLPSSKPPTFTPPPSSSQFPLHPPPRSFSFQHQVGEKSWNNAFITNAKSKRPELPKTKSEVVVNNCSSKEQKFVHEGLITESLPNGMFMVRLDNNEEVILGYVCGKIRSKFIRIVAGDRVRVEVSRYDSTKGRIIYRLDSEAKIRRLGKAKGR